MLSFASYRLIKLHLRSNAEWLHYLSGSHLLDPTLIAEAMHAYNYMSNDHLVSPDTRRLAQLHYYSQQTIFKIKSFFSS